VKISEKKSACHYCGTLVTLPLLDREHQYNCPECGMTLYRPGQPFSLVLLLALTTLIMLIPSLIYTQLSLEIMSIDRQLTLFDTIRIFFGTEYIPIAYLIFITGIIIPIVTILLVIYMISDFKIRNDFHKIKWAYFLYVKIRDWGYLDVYLLSFFISMVKLKTMGELHAELGLVSFTFAMLFYFLTIYFFNEKDLFFKGELCELQR